jgi:hypothetical protein
MPSPFIAVAESMRPPMISFERDIRPMFRHVDREEMEAWFDLWSFEDVRAHALAIAERLEDLTMPCDEPWSPDRIDAFRSWIGAGFPP